VSDLSFDRQMAKSRALRTDRYAEMVSSYFEMMTAVYRSGWAESLHLPPFRQSESLAEALVAQECALADEGRFGPESELLDVGCGIGGPALTISAYSGAEVTGVNICPAQVVLAQARAAEAGLAERVRFVQGDMMRLLFEADSFDAAYTFDALCHAPDKEAAYREIARVVKPGGLFLGYDWFCANGISTTAYEEYIEPLCSAFAIPGLITLEQCRTNLEKAGFEVEDNGDAVSRGDLTRTWDILDGKARSLAGRSTAPEEIMQEAIVHLVKAARAGLFKIGYWRARKEA
jgi:sterol 24-C-methyltransferase